MKAHVLALAMACAFGGAVSATTATAQRAHDQRTISMYRAAPGHQEQLLAWLARQDEVSHAAGIPASQLYVHQDGASWDYLVVAPRTTPEQDAAFDAAAARMGVASGPRAGIEFRQHIAEHTDTMVAGPTTAADWLGRIRAR